MADNKVVCESCKSETPQSVALYNEAKFVYYCSKQCYLDWADWHAEEVAEFYYKYNIQ